MKKKISSKISNILWATDFSQESRDCLAYVKTLTDKCNTENHALYVLPKFADWIYETAFFTDEELMKTIEKTRQDSLEKIEDLSAQSDVNFAVDVVEGIESEEIIRLAHDKKANLILAGRRGISQIEHILIGSTTSRLIRNSDIPVLVIPDAAKSGRMNNILCPLDFSDSSLMELKYSISLAKQLDAGLYVVHVSEFFNYKVPVLKRDKLIAKINEKISAIVDEYDYDIENIIYETGEPASKIIEVAEKNNIDLIAMATHQRKGIEKFFLGSITEKVLMYSGIPVLVLPPGNYDFS